ncbi:MAG: glycosyltransferase [Candidatus Dormibacteraeota bacterium]|nr:glycosyltransferase [Candidatus Dormibacteraeota bacterium]
MLLQVAGVPIPYEHPWSATFYERRRALVQRARHVAYIYEHPDTSSFRYRVLNMVEALNAAAELDISASWFTRDDIARDIGFIDRADVVVIARTRYDEGIARVIARARARGVRVLFDIDDLVFNPDYVHLVADTLGVNLRGDEDWNFWFAYIARLGATLRGCDAAIVTNPFLGERVGEYAPAVPVRVVPNFLNRMQTEVSRSLVARKRVAGYRRDGRVDLGYFSGTPTHNRDLLIASPALAALFERFPSLRLRIVGFIDLNGYLAPYRSRIEICPLQDYLNLQRLAAEVELSIAPLQHNDFTNCKSELKYFEAAVVGVPTMASPTYTFTRAITDGANGFIAGSDEWEEKIADFIGFLDRNPGGYAQLSERVVTESEARYGWDRQARAIEAAVFG